MWSRAIPLLDPAAAAARLRGRPGLALLDSAMRHDALGRYSYLAADPFGSFRVRGGRAFWNGAPVPGAPLEALRAVLAPWRIEPDPDLPPFQGGAIGTIAYDFGASLEQVAPSARRAGLTDDMAFNLYPTVVAFDHPAGTCHLIATGLPVANRRRASSFCSPIRSSFCRSPRCWSAQASRLSCSFWPSTSRIVSADAADTLCTVNSTPPFGSATGQDIATLSNRIQHEVPASLTSLGVPSDVDRALLSALAKEPAQRPDSASSLADALGGSGGRAPTGRSVFTDDGSTPSALKALAAMREAAPPLGSTTTRASVTDAR